LSFLFCKSVDISDDHVCGASGEDISDLTFECTGKCYGLEVFTACKRVGTDLGYGSGNGNGGERFASPECHFADGFQTFGKLERLEIGAEGECLLSDLGYACGNGYGFKLALEAEDTLTNTDLKNGICVTVIHFVFGIEYDVIGGFILFPVENGNADFKRKISKYQRICNFLR